MPVLAPPCVKPLDLYRPRDPRASDLWRLMDEHFDSSQQFYDVLVTRWSRGVSVCDGSCQCCLRCSILRIPFPSIVVGR
jgi:hypothetical protein